MKTKDFSKFLKGNLDRDTGKKKRAALKKVLRKLKRKEVKLGKKLQSAKADKDKKSIAVKLKVNRAHRKKGVSALRRMSGKG